MSHSPPTLLLFTGHLLDSADRQKDRFLIWLLEDAHRYLKTLDEFKAYITGLLVSGNALINEKLLEQLKENLEKMSINQKQ